MCSDEFTDLLAMHGFNELQGESSPNENGRYGNFISNPLKLLLVPKPVQQWSEESTMMEHQKIVCALRQRVDVTALSRNKPAVGEFELIGEMLLPPFPATLEPFFDDMLFLLGVLLVP